MRLEREVASANHRSYTGIIRKLAPALLVLSTAAFALAYYVELSESTQLVGKYNKAVEDYNLLLTRFNQLSADHANLADKYNRLVAVPTYSQYPTPSDDFRLIGYVDRPREWSIKEPSIIIRFSNPSECLRRVTLSGSSMMPMMGHGNEIIMNRCFRPEDLRLGDIIAFTDKVGDHVIHQIIEVESEGVVTKGINNRNNDGLVRWNQIEAKVVGVMF